MTAGPRCTLSRILSTAIIAGIVAASAAPGQAQGPQRRRGGPRDWSQGRLVATRFGPDGDGSIGRNWRTRLKHHQIETARQRRAPRPILDFFEALGERLGARRLPPGDAGVDWNLRTGGTGSVIGSPAKYNFDIDAANCSDVIYFTVDHAGRPSRVNVIAITNPYVGCPGNPANLTPTVKFGLRLPHGVPTSPVPSLDGEVLYVIESRPSVNGGMILHAINVDNITTNVGTYNYTTTRWSSAHALAAPSGTPDSEQLFQLTLAGVTNTLSSPYLDYESNQIFFGDSQGRIHRVTNVHTAAAARDTTNFPVQCGTQALHSPVFVNGQVFVSGMSGRLYRIDMNGPGPYTCVGAHQGGTGASIGGAHSPVLVDVSNNKILLITNDSEQNGVREIAAYDLDFANNDQPTSVSYLGAASTSIIPVTPALDDQFWSTNDGSIYGVGAPASGAGTQLWRIPYNGELGGTASGYANLTRSGGGAATVATSPVTEFLTASASGNPDFIFVGGASGNYQRVNRISAGFAGTTGSPVAMAGSFAPAGGVISGIIIDTRTTSMTGTTATANIYFGTIGNGATQSTIVQLAQQF